MAPNDRSFSLTFTAGSPGYESVAELRIAVTNIDDNPPVLDKEGLQNEVGIRRLRFTSMPISVIFVYHCEIREIPPCRRIVAKDADHLCPSVDYT